MDKNILGNGGTTIPIEKCRNQPSRTSTYGPYRDANLVFARVSNFSKIINAGTRRQDSIAFPKQDFGSKDRAQKRDSRFLKQYRNRDVVHVPQHVDVRISGNRQRSVRIRDSD